MHVCECENGCGVCVGVGMGLGMCMGLVVGICMGLDLIVSMCMRLVVGTLSTALLNSELDFGAKALVHVPADCDIDPDKPVNMSISLAFEWIHAAPQSFCC